MLGIGISSIDKLKIIQNSIVLIFFNNFYSKRKRRAHTFVEGFQV